MADASQTIVERSLHKIARQRHYAAYELEITPVSTGGANYSSRLFRGKIITKKEHLKFFSKVASIGEELRSQMPTQIYFIEQYAYNKLAQIYENIQDKHGVPKDQRLAMPVLYGYDETVNEEVIVLQDLEAEGFTTQDRLQSFDWKYAAAATQQLARLHALSLAMQSDCPEQYEEVANTLKTKQVENEEFMQNMIQQTITRAVDMIKEKNKERLSAFLEKIMPKINNDMFYEIPPRPVLIHGDFRMSNIMHKVHEDGNVELILIDYQTLHMGSVAKDLMYFVVTGSDAAFRRQHYRPLVLHYYRQLCLALTRLHLDPEQVFPREYFVADLKKNLELGLVIAVFTLPVVTVAEEDAPPPDEVKKIESIMNMEVSDLCRERLNDVVDDFIEWGVL